MFLCLFFGNGVKAARLYFELDKKEIGITDFFSAKVFLDTGFEAINAVDLNVGFSSETLKYKDFSDGNSLINFWIVRPQSNDTKINLAGIIANGYEGKNGLLGSLTFEAIKDGTANIFFEDNSQIAKNNENGELANIVFSNLDFLISRTSNGIETDIKSDTILPESFKPEMSKKDGLFNGKYFLSFATSDKNSGIDHYEVKEGDSSFVITESPYVLKNQRLNQEIQVKVIDKAGNERIEKVNFDKIKEENNSLIYIIIFFVLLLIIISFYLVARKKSLK